MKDMSYWMDTASRKPSPAFAGEEECDVAVVGAGITGISTAVLLVRRGIRVIVLEADRAGSGTTGSTTAKITIQHGLKYHTMPEDKALAYAEANKAGLKTIRAWIDEYKMDCDFSKTASYVYTRDPGKTEDIEQELRAYERLELGGRLVSKTGLPFDVESAIVIENQARFHPMKYLYGLIDIFLQNGGRIYEHSKVLQIDQKECCIIQTSEGRLTANAVVLATNYPLMDFPGLYFMKLHQERSYIISADAKSMDVQGMYINAGQPVQSIRMHDADGAGQLLLGGFGHRTAEEDDHESGYQSLSAFLQTDFKAANPSPAYGWSAQDCVPLDGMPYIGRAAKDMPNVFVATGYAKWGMTNSAAAAVMLTDMISQTDTLDPEIRKQFDPGRFTPGASAKNFFIQGAKTIQAFTAGNLKIPVGSIDNIAPGKGAVLRIGGKAQAVYKDKTGRVYRFGAHCTHMGCPLEYNEADQSFDCPCHGSRFSMHGDVLEGPAQLPLKKIEDETDQ